MRAALLVAACIAFCITTHGRDIKMRSGQIYKKVTVAKVNATGISITHEDGAAFLDFPSLPTDIQKEFGYDATGYAAAAAAKQEQEALAEVQRRATAAAIASQQLADTEASRARAEAFTRERQRIQNDQAAVLAADSASIQNRDYSTPSYSSRDYSTPRYSGGSVSVSGYTRKDGTYVHSYTRRR